MNMKKEVIKNYEAMSIHDRMDIHESLLMESNVSVIESYYEDFGSENAIIAQAMALNKNTPSKILSELIKTERYLSNVLTNPNTPSVLVDEYATHKDFKYRMSILANPSISDNTLDILCDDTLGMVMWAARDLKKKRELI